MPRWFDSVNGIWTAICTATAVPKQLGMGIPPTKRIVLVAKAGAAAFVVPQGQPAGVGFPIPNMPADGAYHTIEFYVNSPEVLYIVGSGDVYWFAEFDRPE